MTQVAEALTVGPDPVTIDFSAKGTQVGVKQMTALGWTVGQGGIKITPSRLVDFTNYKLARPTTVGQLRTLIGRFSFVNSAVPSLSALLRPLQPPLGARGDLSDLRDNPATAEWAKSIDAAIDRLVGDVEQRMGAPLALAIHAAGSVLLARVEDYPLEEASALVSVNLLAGFALARALVPRMRATGGTIGFISSGTAYRAVPFQWAYAASKAGIERLAEALRLELTGQPVQIRVVSPGPVDTAMNSSPPAIGAVPMLSAGKKAPSAQEMAPAILAAFAGSRARVELNRRVTITRWLSGLGAEPLDWLLRRTFGSAIAASASSRPR